MFRAQWVWPASILLAVWSCSDSTEDTPSTGGDGGEELDGGPVDDDGGVTTPDAAFTVDATTPSGDTVLVGAGDIAACTGLTGTASEATAKLLDAIPGAVFTAGDNAYTDGTAVEFGCFDKRWGRHKNRIIPVTGNHDYHQKGAAQYFKYFGAAAGDPTKGYYSLDVGAWHVAVVNSNCSEIGGCTATSPQGKWLDADLKAHPNKCTMAIWHHPLFNMGNHGPATEMKPIWQILYNNNADVVVNGHDHNYQRWKAQDADGKVDTAKGLVELLVGTGGAGFYDFDPTPPNVVAKDNVTNGVIKFTLRANDLDFEFIPVAGQTFTDKGTITCH